MLVPKPLSGERTQNKTDVPESASPSSDGINQLRDESLGAGEPSAKFLQLVREVSQKSGPGQKSAAKPFEQIKSPFRDAKDGSDHEVSAEGLTDRFADVSVRHVHGPHPHRPKESPNAPAGKTAATVYGDGAVDISAGDGRTVTADPESGQISLSSEAGTFTSDSAGDYYFTDKNGNRQQIDDEAKARACGAELENGSLKVGQYSFDGNRLTLADGSCVSVAHGRTHARFVNGDGARGDVAIESSADQSVVSSDGGCQSLVSGNDAFMMDNNGKLSHVRLNNGADDAEPGVPHHSPFEQSPGDKSVPLGGVPIREAMMTLFSLADSLRGKSVITAAEYSALQAASTELNNASVACKDLHNWGELHFVNGVSSAVDRFLSNVSIGSDGQPLPPSVPRGQGTELAESIAEPYSQDEGMRFPAQARPNYLSPLRFDVPSGVWANTSSDQIPLTNNRIDNPGMLSDAAVSEASRILPIEKAYVVPDDGWVSTPSTNYRDQISIGRADRT